MMINFNPFPKLSTERLSLRQINNNDENEIFILRSDPNIMKYIPRPLARSLADVSQLIEKINIGLTNNESINWAITLKNDNKLMGIIGYVRMAKEHHRAEVGYILHPDFHGKGIMREALTAVIDYGFSIMKLHSIEAIINPDNISSEKLLQKNKFIKEAHFKENFFHDGKFLDSAYYSLITSVE
jgi:[ribosomal protein S5]-alanine N-acetyltransferase